MTTKFVVLTDGGAGAAPAGRRCEPCNLEFTPRVLERHLAQEHRLDHCRLCSKPVLSFQVTPLGATLDFCSGTCVASVRRLHLCFKCMTAKTHDPEAYFCLACTKRLGARVAKLNGIKRAEMAIEHARWLPPAYRHDDPNAWKLRYLRKDDVA